mmetsp:Transcript_47213/g.102784  ORF Transcript_47213/g.102784 Transcript_47213/m.102784 type:complete len:165 (+) Transcript_47213:204-698(+)
MMTQGSAGFWPAAAVLGLVVLIVADQQVATVGEAQTEMLSEVAVAALVGALCYFSWQTAGAVKPAPPAKVEACDDCIVHDEAGESVLAASQPDNCSDTPVPESAIRSPCARWNAHACKARPGCCRYGHYCSTCDSKKARHRAGSRYCPHVARAAQSQGRAKSGH